MDDITALGVAMLIIDRVFAFVKPIIDGKSGKKANGGVALTTQTLEAIATMARQIDTLTEQHARTDETGRPLWYVPSSLADAIDRQTTVIERAMDIIRQQTTLLQVLETKIDAAGRE